MFLCHIITTECNLSCKYCFYQCNLSPKIMKKEFSCEQLYYSAANCGFTSVSITGGEPILDNRIVEILSAIKHNGLYCTLLTNGTLLKQDLLDKFRKIGLDQIIISIDSSMQSLHDSVRGKYNDVVRGLRLVANNFADIELTASVVLGRDNLFQIPELINFLGHIGVENALLTLPATPDGKIPFSISKQEFDNLFHRISESRFVHTMTADQIDILKNAIFSANLPKGECDMGNTSFVIDPDGCFLPCFHRRDLAFGNCYQENMEISLERWFKTKKSKSIRMMCFQYNCLCVFAPVMIHLEKKG